MSVGLVTLYNVESVDIEADYEDIQRAAKKMISTMLHELPKETHAMCMFNRVLKECEDILDSTVVKFDGLK